MAFDRKLYPPEWETEIRPRILARAGHRCQQCQAEPGKPHPVNGKKVILQIAHLDRDPWNWNVSDDRLKCYCTRCHLNYDRQANREKRIRGRKYGRNYRRKQLGMAFLNRQDSIQCKDYTIFYPLGSIECAYLQGQNQFNG